MTSQRKEKIKISFHRQSLANKPTSLIIISPWQQKNIRYVEYGAHKNRVRICQFLSFFLPTSFSLPAIRGRINLFHDIREFYIETFFECQLRIFSVFLFSFSSFVVSGKVTVNEHLTRATNNLDENFTNFVYRVSHQSNSSLRRSLLFCINKD